MPDPAATGPLHCSFCLKSQHEVARLVGGPGNLYICDGCVRLCSEWIAGRTPTTEIGRLDQAPSERLLERLKPIEATIRGHGNLLQTAVDTLRAREVSWAEIGKALGISRQSAWERFARARADERRSPGVDLKEGPD